MRIDGLTAAFGPNTAVAFTPEIHRRPELDDPELQDENQLSETGRPLVAYGTLPTKRARKAKNKNGVNPLLSLDLKSLAKRLNVSRNKLHILRMLRRHDWVALLRIMPKEMLVNALRFFSKEKLVRLLMNLPKPLLIKFLLKIFKLADLIKKMPTSELLRILRNKRVNNRELAKGIMTLDPKFILQLLQKIYGYHDYSKLKPYDIFKIFMQTPKERILEAFKTMPFKALQQITYGLVKKDPELLMGLSEAFIFKLLSRTTKPALIEGATILPQEILIKLLLQLPDQFLMIAAAQIDDSSFEAYLIDQHPEILQYLASAA